MQPTETRIPPAKPRRWFRRALAGLVIAAPVVAAAGLNSLRAAENRVLASARARMDRGDWEGAAGALAPFRGKLALSGAARREGAEIYFRLGEDHTAHELLGATPFNAKDPEDVRLRDWSARNQRAAKLVDRSARAATPSAALTFLRRAQEEAPEAPGILERIVRTELAQVATSQSPTAMEEFQRDYTDLRAHASHRAEAVKAKVGALLAKGSEAR